MNTIVVVLLVIWKDIQAFTVVLMKVLFLEHSIRWVVYADTILPIV